MRRDIDSILAEKGVDALLLYSESFKNPNMYYVTRFLAPDPFIFLKKLDGRSTVVVNPMEFPRAKKESAISDIRSYDDYNYVKLVKAVGDPKLGMMKFLASVAEKELGKGTIISVPYDFASIATDVLRQEGLIIRPMFNVIEMARETKEPEEIREIKEVQEIMEKAASEVIDMIGNCEIGPKDTLIHRTDGKKEPLTVGEVKAFIAHRLLDNWCSVEEDIIVTCGPRSADPHYHGDAQDEIKANQPLILDIYPRSIGKRYWADMTRTVVRGNASDKIRRMFDAGLEAKNSCIDSLHEGVLGCDMFNLCCDILEKAGFDTVRGGKKVERGFTHGLGHGVGLEIHESPNMSELYRLPLKEHSIVTVEPGLYDPMVGGVRIEDLVEVGKKGCSNLTKIPVELEI